MKPRGRLLRTPKAAVLLFSLLAVFLAAGSGMAEDKYWVAGDGVWSVADNWGPTGVPVAGDVVYLSAPATVTYDHSLNPGLGTVNIGSDTGNVLFDHSAGTLTIGGNNSLIVNGGSGGTQQYAATYNLSGTGVLVKELFEVKIGTTGLGYFNQSGGTFQLSGALYLGDEATGRGAYTMTGGEITAGPTGLAGIVLGEWGGRGDFLQSGGTVTIDNLTLARQEGSSGYYTLSGDQAVALNLATASVGARGIGVFTQNGGTHTVTGELIVGEYPTGNGTYNLNSGILTANNLFVGSGGSGVFNQTGSSVHTVLNDLIIGQDTFSQGTSTITDNGSLTVGGSLHLGDEGGTGLMTQSGASSVSVAGDLNLGARSETGYLGTGFGSGTYELNGGTLTVGWAERVGLYGRGTFTQSGKSQHRVGSDLVLANEGGSSGSYVLNGGDLQVGQFDGLGNALQSGGTFVGLNGTGTFTQRGGSHRISADLNLGQEAGSQGTYSLENGILFVGRNEHVGLYGTGSFVQIGGTHTVAGDLVLGNDTGTGTYTLGGDASTTLAVGGVVYVGMSGAGRFDQTGGVLTATNDLNLGQVAGSVGEFNLGGTGVVNIGRTLYVGLSGTGVFTQRGDSRVNVAREDGGGGAILGSDESRTGTGTYNLHGGTITSNYMIVGAWGNGTVNQTGGVNTTGDLTIGDRGTGVYNLSGGTLNANNVVNNGTFNYTGGTLVATSDFRNNAGATTRISGIDGSIGSVINAGAFNVNGILNITGGEFVQTAGTLSGSGQINGNVSVSGGTVAPGNSPGILTINGDYSQGESAVLVIEILNGTAGSGYDRLNVSGTATLGGTIDLALLDGYSITDGQSFDILHYAALSGEFARWLGLDPEGSLYFTYEYTANDLILTAHTAEAPVPVPGAIWLLVPGLAAIAVLRRRLGA
jgi:hypothetical protein